MPPAADTEPLATLRVVEVGGIGAVPFCGMVLADLGAEVIRVTRPGEEPAAVADPDPLLRGRTSIELDLKSETGRERLLALLGDADALIEGFRPGVMERLGLGPERCREVSERLVFARMTGWGQDGPHARRAGHDINFLALSGTLAALGPRGGPPAPPLNLLADFGGGGMLLALGVLAGVVAARESGRGRVVDAAMLDGSALLATMIHGFRAAGRWREEPGTNLLDGAAPFYRAYECADGRFLALGAIEPEFYVRLLEGLGLDAEDLPGQYERESWPALGELFASTIAARGRDEWARRFATLDACVTPVLTMAEAPLDAHNRARGVFTQRDGIAVPAPAPRFAGLGEAVAVV